MDVLSLTKMSHVAYVVYHVTLVARLSTNLTTLLTSAWLSGPTSQTPRMSAPRPHRKKKGGGSNTANLTKGNDKLLNERQDKPTDMLATLQSNSPLRSQRHAHVKSL